MTLDFCFLYELVITTEYLINSRQYPEQCPKTGIDIFASFQCFTDVWKLCVVFKYKRIRKNIQQVFTMSFGLRLVQWLFTVQLRAVWGHHPSCYLKRNEAMLLHRDTVLTEESNVFQRKESSMCHHTQETSGSLHPCLLLILHQNQLVWHVIQWTSYSWTLYTGPQSNPSAPRVVWIISSLRRVGSGSNEDSGRV